MSKGGVKRIIPVKNVNTGQLWKHPTFALGLVVAAVLLPATPPVSRGAPTAVKITHRGETKTKAPASLVRCDYELCDFLKKARKHIADKEYSEGIKILQALIEKDNTGFAAREDGKNRRFVSLRSEAVSILGTIPEKNLESYRRLYDSKARSKFDKAVKTSDISALKQIANIYALTSIGPLTIGRLGEIQFDRGQFAQAAEYWKQLLKITSDPAKKPLLLLKIAIASHLGGLDDQSKKFADELRQKYPGTTGVLGGHRQNFIAFLDSKLKIPPASAPIVRRFGKSYPGWGGIPNGLGTMSDCSVLMLPKWKFPAIGSNKKNIYKKLIPQSALSSLEVRGSFRGFSGPDANQDNSIRAELVDGNIHIRLGKGRGSTKKPLPIVLPAIIRPVVINNTILYRGENRIIALDIFTGQLLWKSPALPMEADVEVDTNNSYYYSGGQRFTEKGRYALTAGGGKVFTIYGFAPQIHSYGRNAQKIDKSSSLAGLSTEGEGKLLWCLGRGGSKDNELKGFTFVSLPGYVEDKADNTERLYTIAVNSQAYYLIALDADTGKVIWKTPISQIPAGTSNRFGPLGYNNSQTLIGTPPVYYNGRVFAATNAGILAAVDASSGQPLWAYQYAFKLPNIRSYRGRGGASIMAQVNPLIVTQRRLLALPADSSEVMGLSTGDGSLLWKTPSSGTSQLTAVDADRICLSGEKLTKVLRATDGKELFRSNRIKSLTAHPAVTPTQIITCGNGTLKSISLDDYSITTIGPVEAGGLLGTLISTNEMLLAANSFGVCAYFGFDSGFAELSKRLKNASRLERPKLLMQRASLCDSVKMHDKALGDLLESQKTITTIADGEAKEKLNRKIHRRLMNAYIAKANRATGPTAVNVMLENFQTAKKFADAPQDKAAMQLRMAKYYEWVGNLEKAVEAANLLVKNYDNVRIADVSIGHEAANQNKTVRWGSKTAAQIGNDFIERLLQIHGQGIYTTFNARAKKALDVALAANDIPALEAVKTDLPHSKWGNEAIFLAAEIAYRTGDIPKSMSLLCVIAGQKNNPHRISASVALITICTQQKWTQAAKLTRNELDGVPEDTPIKFANITGTLGEVLKKIDGGEVQRPTTNPTTKPATKTPVSPNINDKTN